LVISFLLSIRFRSSYKPPFKVSSLNHQIFDQDAVAYNNCRAALHEATKKGLNTLLSTSCSIGTWV
jgi:hypothetical protein